MRGIAKNLVILQLKQGREKLREAATPLRHGDKVSSGIKSYIDWKKIKENPIIQEK